MSSCLIKSRTAGTSGSRFFHLAGFLLLMFSTESAFTQRFYGELMAGAAGTQISGDELSGFNKAGIITGAGIRTSIHPKMDAGFRMLYFQKGSRRPLKNDGTDTAYYLLRLNYAEIPLTFRYRIRNQFLIEAGPSLGYLISSYEENELGELAFRRPFYNFDLSLTGSFVYELSERMNFLFSYWQSLLPVREHASGETYRLNQGQYSSVISFSLVYSLKRTAPGSE